ncbi:HAMP domain-containing sensor histidine kinase [Nocardioides dilutus]
MSARPRRRRPGFATRLLAAQALVLVAMSLTAWVVASAVGPGIFQDHLHRAGVDHTPSESQHIEEAFASALLLALTAALLIAIVLAMVVTWYFSRRTQASISRLAQAAATVGAGDYGSRVPRPGLGGEFDQFADTFNALAERLEAVESTRRRMLADLAHEMRTPLATLEAHLEALQDGVRQLDEATFDVLSGSTERLRRLADDIGAVSRAQEGELEIHLEPTDPGDLVEAATGACADRYRGAGVDLSTDLDAELTVLADPARMGQVLANLLDNALRHTPEGGSVQVSCHRTDRGVEIEVSDSGEGIQAAHLSHVFDRFYRADPARNSINGGSGIGLTISKALVEAQGGEISAHSDGPGLGARFVVRLPDIQEGR